MSEEISLYFHPSLDRGSRGHWGLQTPQADGGILPQGHGFPGIQVLRVKIPGPRELDWRCSNSRDGSKADIGNYSKNSR